MINHPQKGRGWAHVTHFCSTVNLEKFRNNAVDGGPVFHTSIDRRQ